MPFLLAYFDIYICINNLQNPKRDIHIVIICRKSTKCQYRPYFFKKRSATVSEFVSRLKRKPLSTYTCWRLVQSWPLRSLSRNSRRELCDRERSGQDWTSWSQIHSRSLSRRSLGQCLINRENSGNENGLKPAEDLYSLSETSCQHRVLP